MRVTILYCRGHDSILVHKLEQSLPDDPPVSSLNYTNSEQ